MKARIFAESTTQNITFPTQITLRPPKKNTQQIRSPVVCAGPRATSRGLQEGAYAPWLIFNNNPRFLRSQARYRDFPQNPAVGERFDRIEIIRFFNSNKFNHQDTDHIWGQIWRNRDISPELGEILGYYFLGQILSIWILRQKNLRRKKKSFPKNICFRRKLS